MIMRLFFIIILGWVSTLHAGGLSLGQSRVIFTNINKGEVVLVRNEGDSALLIQMSVLDIKNEQPVSTFLLNPPLFRIDSKSEHAVRVLSNDISGLPGDRESGFYLKVRGIPPSNKKEEGKDKPEMIFITAIVIKLYYRPDGIPEPGKKDFEQVKLRYENGKWQFNNPTPYYMTIVDFNIDNSIYPESILVSPFSNYVLTDVNKNISKMSWRFLDDYGAGTERFSIK